MSDFVRLGLMAVLAFATTGCGRADETASKRSVTVQLPPARPYSPEPGFSLATDPAGDLDQEAVEPGTLSRS